MVIKKYEFKKIFKKFNELPNYYQEIINKYILNAASEFEKQKNQELNLLISLLSLKNFSDFHNNKARLGLKNDLLNKLQKKPKKNNGYNESQEKIAFVDKSFNFGNSLVLLNNLLYYCEILNISKIYLNSDRYWPICDNFISHSLNITLVNSSNIDKKKSNFYEFDKKLIYSQQVIRPEIRINLLKNQIKKYLPKINIDEKDLYIHIRGGDIFGYNALKNINYAQPPLCFYKSVINNFKFRNIFILSMDQENPVIEELVKSSEIILLQNGLKQDIQILSNAYNLVGSVSSFFSTSLLINDNLKYLWEYEYYSVSQKYLHLHHDIYSFSRNYTIYRMNTTQEYIKKMFPWRNSKSQRILMLNIKCGNFNVINQIN